MQISGSLSSYNTGTSNKSTGSASSGSSQGDDFYQQLADYKSPKNTLFQNLIQENDVKDNVTLNDDGSYTWKDNANGSLGSYHEWLAKGLIGEQNSTQSASATKNQGGITDFSVNDLAKFRQLTGYNLVHTGQLTYIVDDHGNPPPASETDRLNAAWQTFDSAKGGQDLDGNSGSDLSFADLKEAALGVKASYKYSHEDTSSIDAIMDALDKVGQSEAT